MALDLSRRPYFGLLRYRYTGNLGDEIQSIAARAFLPRVDRWLDRDALDRAPGWPGETAAILNGWFSHAPERWPPHPRLRPLLLSMHLSDQRGPTGFSAAEAWVVGRRAAYLRDNGPVGARDLWTLELLRRNDIECAFSGCLTLTLQRPEVPRGEAVVASDLDTNALAALRTRARVVVTVTHRAPEPSGIGPRMALAARLLDIYACARCVVTSRLHAALPCLAMGTPVLLLPARPDMIRMSGLIGLVHHDTPERFVRGSCGYDPEAPPPNPAAHLALASALADRCRAFIHSVSAT